MPQIVKSEIIDARILASSIESMLHVSQIRFALPIRFGSGDFPLLGFFLLAQMLNVNASLAGELRVNLRPLLIYRAVLLPAERDLLAVNLAGVQEEMDMRVLRVAVNCSERNRLRLWERLLSCLSVFQPPNRRLGLSRKIWHISVEANRPGALAAC